MDYLQIFEERQSCFAELLRLANEQRMLIDAVDYAQLLTLLGSKQRVLGQLEEMQRQHPRLAADWKAVRAGLSVETREACEHVLAETEATLAQLLDQERRDTDEIAARRDQTRSQLNSVSLGQKANAAYGAPPPHVSFRHLSVGQ